MTDVDVPLPKKCGVQLMARQSDVANLLSLTRAELRALSKDFRQPQPVKEAARQLLKDMAQEKLQEAVAHWESASPVYAQLTEKLITITDIARADPVGDGVAVLTPIIRRLSELVADIGGLGGHEPPAVACNQKPEDVGAEQAPSPVHVPTSPPPRGSVLASSRLADIAAEYVAMFDAAVLDSSKRQHVDRLCDRIGEHEVTYRHTGELAHVPWHFIGIVHSLEANTNFGLHLHNGDSLMHRTVRVPAGRPPANVAQPPFAWATSALDALTLMNLNTVNDWSLASFLFQLERYNGFGYRHRGLPSPYLWSFSDRYFKGKFVRDGVFDPEAVSKQCGGAVLLKRLIERGIAII
jgi:lysozyme family protein